MISVIILEKRTIYNIAKHTSGASSPHCEIFPQLAGSWVGILHYRSTGQIDLLFDYLLAFIFWAITLNTAMVPIKSTAL